MALFLLFAALLAAPVPQPTAESRLSPSASGVENADALQRMLDAGGRVLVSEPGDYKIARTLLIGDDTTLECASGVRLVKSDEVGPFSQVILNRGALTRTWNRNIAIRGLELVVNGMDSPWSWNVFGLRGQLAFFYVKDLRIERFRCFDVGRMQYCIHICTFEDVVVDDVRIAGWKDGVHFGRGRRFAVRNGYFDTGDDPIALNAHDYSTGNPELGWIEDGVIENCHDMENPERTVGYFCRILAGAWCDWRKGMEVQQSDTVVHGGSLYRVAMEPDGRVYVSLTPPTHKRGIREYDGIRWAWVQDEVTYTCGCRNVAFRNIFLHQPRPEFSIHFDNDRYSRSYYPGAPVPEQTGLTFDNVQVLHDGPQEFMRIYTPVDSISLVRCALRRGGFSFLSNEAMSDYGKTRIRLENCRLPADGDWRLIRSSVTNKVVEVLESGSVRVDRGAVEVSSDGTSTAFYFRVAGRIEQGGNFLLIEAVRPDGTAETLQTSLIHLTDEDGILLPSGDYGTILPPNAVLFHVVDRTWPQGTRFTLTLYDRDGMQLQGGVAII